MVEGQCQFARSGLRRKNTSLLQERCTANAMRGLTGLYTRVILLIQMRVCGPLIVYGSAFWADVWATTVLFGKLMYLAHFTKRSLCGSSHPTELPKPNPRSHCRSRSPFQNSLPRPPSRLRSTADCRLLPFRSIHPEGLLLNLTCTEEALTEPLYCTKRWNLDVNSLKADSVAGTGSEFATIVPQKPCKVERDDLVISRGSGNFRLVLEIVSSDGVRTHVSCRISRTSRAIVLS